MAELLLELFSEEIPARMQARAADDLRRLVGERLAAAGLARGQTRSFATPRRLVLVVDGLPLAQADQREEKKGPRVGSPEKAIEGFLRGAGLASLDQCERRQTDKGEFWFAVTTRRGRATAELLGELLPEAIAALPWPKSMKWAGHDIRWVRPLHAILCLFDGKTVPVRFGPIVAGNETRGHRFLAPAPFAVRGFADYRDRLRAAHVMLDAAERRATIVAEARRLAAAEKLELVPDEALLDEVAGLVEWPVLTTSMRANQKYFTLNRADGTMAPRFVVVANTPTENGGKLVVAGNERVLRARLADAKFFWDQDRKATLESRVPALRNIVFHAKLGTVADKVERMVRLAEDIALRVPGADPAQCRRAARLAKADLVSGMVGEFPELQGVMGRYYALHDGEDAAVAEVMAEHYSPLGPGDRCPSAPTSVVVALADKIDSLVGFFKIDERPTGSKDPFALRRAALGAIRLIVENRLRISLMPLFEAASTRHGAPTEGALDPLAALLDFFADRLKVHLREKGVRHDLVSAVFAARRDDDLVRLLARVDALKDFLGGDDGANLLMAYRRAANIVRIEEKRDGRSYEALPDPDLLRQDEEIRLFDRLSEVSGLADAALAHEEFAAAGTALARLRGPVDAFFDKVTVNTEDAALRANRLMLLARIRAELDKIADFSKIEG